MKFSVTHVRPDDDFPKCARRTTLSIARASGVWLVNGMPITGPFCDLSLNVEDRGNGWLCWSEDRPQERLLLVR
jgi:hypothetical protein